MSALPKVLVVDDKPNMVGLLSKVLAPIAQITTAGTVQQALQALGSDAIAAVVCDLRLPDGDGLEVLRACQGRPHRPPFILVTAYASVETAVQAMREGALDYVTKPFDPDEVAALVERALSRSLRHGQPAATVRDGLGPMLGRAARMQEVFRLIERVAPTDTSVLILGETGTGKELAARAIHELSERAQRPLCAINCAAIPRSLLESELFGHVKGAFTGAAGDRMGLFEAAGGGTVFLDEIGEMRPSMQAKLTRVLEARAVRRLGDARERPVNFRLIAATHRNLRAMVKEGTFREDLWFRLNVCTLELPALRDRPDDIPLLAEHFLRERGPGVKARAQGFSDEAMQRLLEYAWPGNVRELRSVVERAALVEESSQIGLTSLPSELREVGPVRPLLSDAQIERLSLREALARSRDEVSRRYVALVTQRHGGDVSKAAEQAGIKRSSFYRLLRRYGLVAGDFRAEDEDGEEEEET